MTTRERADATNPPMVTVKPAAPAGYVIATRPSASVLRDAKSVDLVGTPRTPIATLPSSPNEATDRRRSNA